VLGRGTNSLAIDWQAANYRSYCGLTGLKRPEEADDPVRERAGQVGRGRDEGAIFGR
jgi:hypothetical protein